MTTSIFVRNLPEEITQPKLEETFSRYGPIKGVSLRQQKGKVGSGYAFIDYEDQASMHAAIAAQTLIDDKPVQVMERKPLLPREARPFGGRGGRGEGRGFRGRNDGRGRGREGRPHTTGGRSEGRPDGDHLFGHAFKVSEMLLNLHCPRQGLRIQPSERFHLFIADLCLYGLCLVSALLLQVLTIVPILCLDHALLMHLVRKSRVVLHTDLHNSCADIALLFSGELCKQLVAERRSQSFCLNALPILGPFVQSLAVSHLQFK